MNQPSIVQSRFRIGLALAALMWLVAVGVDVASGHAALQKTVADGVYTAAQADRGQAVFEAQCASCHSPADYTGDEFLKKWDGQPLYALYDVVKTTMPMDNPGTLKPEQYADVVSYLLKLNKFPAGEEELKPEADAMKAVSFTKKGP
jgi:mono/diheme cytochrome c family protein